MCFFCECWQIIIAQLLATSNTNKMKYFPILLLILFSVTYSIAQVNEIKIPLAKDEELFSQINLSEAGFLLRTNQRIMKFSGKNEKLWEHAITNNGVTVASSDGSKIYLVDYNSGDPLRKPQHITVLEADGKIQEHDVEEVKNYGKETTEIFASNEYLFYLTRDEISKKEEALFLNSFNAETMAYKKIKLEVPQAKDAYWQYLGQWDEKLYLFLKDIEKARPVNTIHIASLDAKGTLLGIATIPFSLENNFTRPSKIMEIERKEWLLLADHAFSEGTYTMSSPGPMQGTYNQNYFATGLGPKVIMARGPESISTMPTAYANSDAFITVSMDRNTGNLYVYGLMGEKPMNKSGIANKYEGFYIGKYDLQGNEQWKLQHTEIPELTDEKIFYVHGAQAERRIIFTPLLEGKISFNINFRRTLVSYSITEDGKVSAFKKTKAVSSLRDYYSELPVEFPKSESGKSVKKTYQEILAEINTINVGADGFTVTYYSPVETPSFIHLAYFPKK